MPLQTFDGFLTAAAGIFAPTNGARLALVSREEKSAYDRHSAPAHLGADRFARAQCVLVNGTPLPSTRAEPTTRAESRPPCNLNLVLLRKLRELDVKAPTAPERPAYVSAASGLVVVGSQFYVVADDEMCLGVFPLIGNEPGTWSKIFAGDLPTDKAERKHVKPDLESLLLLPPLDRSAQCALFAIGSGARSTRSRGALLPLDADGAIAGPTKSIDLSLLFAAFARQVGELNIEGAVVLNDKLQFLQRGNKGAGINALIAVALSEALRSLAEGHTPELSFNHREYELGSIDDIPLGFTDAAALPDGRIVFTAVAEDTDNSFSDGRCAGACVGILAADGQLQGMQRLQPSVKVEGIDARVRNGRTQLLLVSDADDTSVPASLYEAEIE